MNTRHAQIILTTLREGSFTAAARALYITQPTLSQTVKQIETQLGEPIFARGKAPLTLTPAGELYVQAARRMLQIETQLSAAIDQLHGRARGTLRLGVMIHRSCELLPQIFSDFSRTYPEVSLEVTEETAAALTALLERGELDMALIVGGKDSPSLTYRQIASDEIVLLAGKRSALAQRIPSGSTISLTEAAQERFVLPGQDMPSRAYFDALLSAYGLTPSTAMTCDNVETAMRVAVSCDLVMLSPFISLLCSGNMQKLSHYHLGSEAFLPPMRMAYLTEQPLSAPAEALYAMLSSRFRAMTAYRV